MQEKYWNSFGLSSSIHHIYLNLHQSIIKLNFDIWRENNIFVYKLYDERDTLLFHIIRHASQE